LADYSIKSGYSLYTTGAGSYYFYSVRLSPATQSPNRGSTLNESAVIANAVWQSMNPLFSTMDRRAALAMSRLFTASIAIQQGPVHGQFAVSVARNRKLAMTGAALRLCSAGAATCQAPS
jgi:hypothetical protein